MEVVNKDIKVLSVMWHQPDNWYGKNYRIVLRAGNELGFNTLKECKQYKSLMIQYAKSEYKHMSAAVKNISVKNVKFSELSKLETYRYCGSGPSWACTNILVNLEALKEFETKYLNSAEYKEKVDKKYWREKRKAINGKSKRK